MLTLLLAWHSALCASSAAKPPPRAQLDLPAHVSAQMIAWAASRALVIDPWPELQAPPPVGTIVLSPNVHLVPIHLYPVRGGMHETLAVVIDGYAGMPSLRLDVAGTGINGGAEGEVNLTRRNALHGTFINTPTLVLVAAENAVTVYQLRLPAGRMFSGLLRPGVQYWSVPSLSIIQAYVQAGTRFDWYVGGTNVHLDTFAGSGAVGTSSTTLGTQYKLTPGLEVSTALVFER